MSAAAAARAPAISRPATTLPGGYCVGDEVFFTGPRQTLPSGGRVEYGGNGEVVGPGVGDDKDVRVSVRFPGNQRITQCLLTNLSHTAPPTTLPGGYCAGDEVFYTAPNETLSGGDRVDYGGKGEVVGPGVGDDKDVCVRVRFPGNQRNTQCLLTSLSRAAPPPR